RCPAFREIIPACSSSLILLWVHLKGHLMKDRHSNRAAILTGPSGHGFAITPDDATDLERPVRALYGGYAGNLAVTFASGVEAVLEGVTGGTILPIRVVRVHATGTSAGAIIGLA